MIRISRANGPRRGRTEPDVNMAPLMDMVFILLIFFLVTTTFTRETGVQVSRPSAVSARPLEKESLQIAITHDGSVYVHDRPVDMLELRGVVADAVRENPEVPVVIIADRRAVTATLVAVMDECSLAGARQIAVAAAAGR